jgi:hypothetical protein
MKLNEMSGPGPRGKMLINFAINDKCIQISVCVHGHACVQAQRERERERERVRETEREAEGWRGRENNYNEMLTLELCIRSIQAFVALSLQLFCKSEIILKQKVNTIIVQCFITQKHGATSLLWPFIYVTSPFSL